jgi:ATP-dependent Lhr-like helicase
MARVAGAYVVLEDGELRLFLERGGRALLTAGEVLAAHLEALVAVAGGSQKLEIQRVNGGPVHSSPLTARLQEAGFGSSPRGMVRWPDRAALGR